MPLGLLPTYTEFHHPWIYFCDYLDSSGHKYCDLIGYNKASKLPLYLESYSSLGNNIQEVIKQQDATVFRILQTL